MDEYALDFLNNLDPGAKQLVQEMLAAVADDADPHTNGFSVKRLRDGGGFLYVLGREGGGASTFQNNRRLSIDITDVLIGHSIAGAKVNPQWPDRFRSFTEAALDWQRKFGGPNDEEVRRRIGRYLKPFVGQIPPFFSVKTVAEEIEIDPERVLRETRMLKGAGVIYSVLSNDSEFGALGLSEPKGVQWAAGGFPSIARFDAHQTNVTVSLHVEVRTIIEQVQASDLDPAVLEQYELRLRRVEEELEKPDGQGRLQTVHDLVETANGSKDLLIPTVGFLASHADKLKTFAEGAGKIVEGIANILPG